MYLHIIDDSLTMNQFIRIIHSNEYGHHHFLVISSSGNFSQVMHTPHMTVLIPSDKNIQKLVRSFHQYKAVFIHNLTYIKSRIILQASTEVVFVWGIWGTDYYSIFPNLYYNLFLPYTRMTNILLGKLSLAFKFILLKLQPIGQLLNLKSRALTQQRAAARINFTFNNMPKHSEVFKYVPIETSRRFHLSYYSIESLTDKLDPMPVNLGTGILIGNSASNTSNHMDAFIALRAHIKDRKVIVPLGYGSSRYRKFVNLAGKAILKEQFFPINDRLPLPEYQRQLLNCNVMIFNHTRAQGLGNIVFGVWAGHKIFLRESNPFYAYLTELGIKIFLIESTWTDESLMPLTENWRESNRRIIEQQYSEDKLKSDFKYLLDQLNVN